MYNMTSHIQLDEVSEGVELHVWDTNDLKVKGGAGHSSDGRMSTCEGFDHPIDPVQWTHLQFGLFSVPASGP